MLQSADPELVSVEGEGPSQCPGEMSAELSNLNLRAAQLAHDLAWLPGQHSARPFRNRLRKLARTLRPLLRKLESPPPKAVSDDFRWLHDNSRLLESELEDIREAFNVFRKLPHVRAQNGEVIPRIAAVAEDYLDAAACRFQEPLLGAYVRAFQQITMLKMTELWALASVLKLCRLASPVDPKNTPRK
jgi:hypothetical protein